MFGKRILILAAHPDDEVVACATATGRAQAQGAVVYVLYLTHGCIARETLWPWQRRHFGKHVERRRIEAEKAATFLGLKPLGWPTRPARHLWRNLTEVHTEIKHAIDGHNIDQLWVPAYEGGNADHDGLNAAGQAFASGLSVLEFAEYNFAGGKPHSQEFPSTKGAERTLALSPEERAKKREALALYSSEKGNLNYVRTERECYRPLAGYDYSRPPHSGKLWYTRFHWVPFCHPRVDFTKPEEVSTAIKGFFGAIELNGHRPD